MHFTFRNVNDAFKGLVSGIHSGEIPTHRRPSRYGEVLQVEEPVIVTYTHPRERVLFNRVRDCNCVFQMFEALWMIASRNDVEPLAYYNPKMREFSDDGKIFHGAYGYRWRHFFGMDQVAEICRALKKNPSCRRQVLQIWSAQSDLGGIGKDLPCNTQAYFSIREFFGGYAGGQGLEDVDQRYLDMTVCNRSNDMIWGMLGANAVHFSFLLEYMAACIGIEVGKYHQITNNMHVYTERWEPEKWLSDDTDVEYVPACNIVPLVKDPAVFDEEVKQFIDNKDWTRNWQEPFLQHVASPMCWAFELHRKRDYGMALRACDSIEADDWRVACVNWIEKRRINWERKNASASAQ